MASFFISAHGNLRPEGSIRGTRGARDRQTQAKFIVPKNVTIYFFCPPGTGLWNTYGDFLMDLLINPSFDFSTELQVREAAYEVIHEGELCFNYTYHTDGPEFRDPMGLYRCGQGLVLTPVIPLPFGTTKTLQQWVQGVGGKDTAFGNHFYCGTCREHDVEHLSPNTQFFREHTQPKAQASINKYGIRPESYTRRYGKAVSPLPGMAGLNLWGGAKGREGRPRTLQENPAKLKELLARLEKGEGLF